MKIIQGDLIALAKEGNFDVIAHGCNCFCTMGSGIAPLMAKAFGVDKYPLEAPRLKGDRNKLGHIEGKFNEKYNLTVINAYTQYNYGRGLQLDYEALESCFKSINDIHKGKRVGLPWIGCGLAGGDKKRVQKMMIDFLPDVELTVVQLEPVL